MVARLQPARQRAHWIKVARDVKRDETNFHIEYFGCFTNLDVMIGES